MFLTPEQALDVLRTPALADVFSNVTLLSGAPVLDEDVQGKYVGVVSTQEDSIEVEVSGPYDDVFLDQMASETDVLDEGVTVSIEGSEHIVALFGRCAKKQGSGMKITLSFDIDPFAM